jgi:hypothetical protein
MTMVVDNQPRQYGEMYDGIYTRQPNFTDPWSHPHTNHTSLYATSLGTNPLGLNSMVKQESGRPTNISMPYQSLPVSAPSLGGSSYATAGYGTSDLLGGLPQESLSRSSYGSNNSYSSASPVANTYATTSSYHPVSYAQSLHQQQQRQQSDGSRRISNTESTSSRTSDPSYGDALDAGRGMVAMSQTDLTPRDIYGPRSNRDSTNSYGFPATHSSNSSISSASNYPYFGGSVASSVDSSVSDYSSTTSESYEPMQSRTLPRPSNLLGANMPPAPQSMMGQFSSKMSSNTQKKHKCKVCDKRFTRPSSLQTHMYSHTGEKRTLLKHLPLISILTGDSAYACDMEGCGRHFSVVSNLRRHKKVHKGEHEPSSPDDE